MTKKQIPVEKRRYNLAKEYIKYRESIRLDWIDELGYIIVVIFVIVIVLL